MGSIFGQNVATLHADTGTELFAALTNGDVMYSPDNGRSWLHLSTVPGKPTVHQFVPHPTNPQRLFAATSDGLFVSTDRGKSWSPVNAAPRRGSCRALAFDPFNTEMMITGIAGAGLFRTTDGGSTWAPGNAGLDERLATEGEIYDVRVDALRPDVVYAAIAGIGIVKSTDAGNSWNRVSDNLAAGRTGSEATHVVLHGSTPNTLCFATSAGGIYRSVNGGFAWSPARPSGEIDRIVSLVASPVNPDLLYAGTLHGLLSSTDFGATWKQVSEKLPRVPTAVTLSRDGKTLHMYGQGLGVQRSTDGGRTWMREDVNLGGASVRTIVTDKAGTVVCASVGTAVFLHRGEPGGWIPAMNGLFGGTIRSLAFAPDSISVLYAGTESGVFKSMNSGLTWAPIARRLPFTDIRFLDTHPVIASRLYASGLQGVFVSTDKGATWVQAKPLHERFNVLTLTFNPRNAGVVQGGISGRGVITSTDGGFNWEHNRFGIQSDDIVAFTYDDVDPQTYYAWTANGDGFRSTSGGLSWDRYAPPWQLGDRVLLSVERSRPQEVVALVNSTQLFYSLNGGGTWFPLQTTLPDAEILTIHWNAARNVVYAGTREKGVYRLSLAEHLRKLFEE